MYLLEKYMVKTQFIQSQLIIIKSRADIGLTVNKSHKKNIQAVVDRFYIALFSALKQTHCALLAVAARTQTRDLSITNPALNHWATPAPRHRSIFREHDTSRQSSGAV